jgi:hypothetical protein
MNRFTEDEIRRYSRQILLREVGGRGQERIQDATATLVCSGAVGETTAQYLGRAGVKRLRLFATDQAAAQRLRGLVESEGGSIGRRMVLLPLLEAPGSLRSSLEAAPPLRYTVAHWDTGGPQEVYWAIADEQAVTVGRGAAEMRADGQSRPPASPRVPDKRVEEESATALLAGSALALFMLQDLLELSPPSPIRI